MRNPTKYSPIKKLLVKFPKLREAGASLFLLFPLPFSISIYRAMRRFVFTDNTKRLSTFDAAFSSIAKQVKVVHYLEFGVARGTSFISAYESAAQCDLDCHLFAFDSFEGLPCGEGNVFAKGDYSYPENYFRAFVSKAGVPPHRMVTIPGFFENSLTPELYDRLGLRRGVHCIHIDSDLYTSAKTVLQWLLPILDSGSVIIFDDWFAFDHMPDPENYGEQKAFKEWSDNVNYKVLHVTPEWNIAFVRG